MLKKNSMLWMTQKILIIQKKIEFDELINNWEVVTKDVIKTISKRNKNLLKDKSSNSLMALGAMEVHLNLALQALNAYNKESED